jgi:hypothetical protein
LNGITNCVLLDEPPCTDPYARWCERGRLAAAPYSILVITSPVKSNENVTERGSLGQKIMLPGVVPSFL